MTAAKAIEYRITQRVLRRREAAAEAGCTRLADRVIIIAAVTAGMLLLGSYLQELMWVLLAASTVYSLGTR